MKMPSWLTPTALASHGCIATVAFVVGAALADRRRPSFPFAGIELATAEWVSALATVLVGLGAVWLAYEANEIVKRQQKAADWQVRLERVRAIAALDTQMREGVRLVRNFSMMMSHDPSKRMRAEVFSRYLGSMINALRQISFAQADVSKLSPEVIAGLYVATGEIRRIAELLQDTKEEIDVLHPGLTLGASDYQFTLAIELAKRVGDQSDEACRLLTGEIIA